MRKPPATPPPARQELEVVSFRLEPEVRVKLDRLVGLTGLSQSEILRRLIESATAQSPKVEANLDRVISRQRYNKAGTRNGALTRTARANGVHHGMDEDDREAAD
jgi:hypothetical protein